MYRGTVVEESLKDKSVLDNLKIVKTTVETVTGEHKTPWLKQWTLHQVEIPDSKADSVTKKLSFSLLVDPSTWYADFKSDKTHYIVFPGKVFHINRTEREYDQVREYGLSLGIPEHQLDFSPEIK